MACAACFVFFCFLCHKCFPLLVIYAKPKRGVDVMEKLTCVVVGGGYAGINAVKALQKSLKGAGRELRLILINKDPYHLRKVLLFKPAALQEDIAVPLRHLFPEGEGVDLVQGEVTRVDFDARQLIYRRSEGGDTRLGYDILVMAAGSMVRRPQPDQGGIALTSPESAEQIRRMWKQNLREAASASAEERAKLLTFAVAGGGISGIETSAELAHAIRADAEGLGLNPADIRVYLVNAEERLFAQGPAKVSRKLEGLLAGEGVTTLHGRKVIRERGGVIALSDGSEISAGLCVWTLGIVPNPRLSSMGFPITVEGKVVVDASYRVEGKPGVYSIGDCAQIVDPETGRADSMTCKEAGAQATRLGQVVAADVEGRPAPVHKGYMDVFCFGLGPAKGMVWTRQWGLDMIIQGRLGWNIRKFTWDHASLLK